jgi:hypothetical protein
MLSIDPKLILDSLKYCYFEELTEDNCYSNIVDYCDSNFFNTGKSENGATKIVLFPHNSNYVVKIPFSHDSYGSYDEDEKPDLFYGAGEPNGWDYCRAEVILYEKAQEANIEECFLKTELLGYVSNHPIYIQEEVEMFFSRNDKSPKDWSSEQEVCNYCQSHNYWCFNSYWIDDFLKFYGEKMFDLLSKFLRDNCIHDLHSGNLGYINDRPVIVDYGSYHE